MTRVLPPAAVLLLLALVGGPMVLDHCVASCSAAAQPSMSQHCHHAAPTSHGSWTAASRCGHDHNPWSAVRASSPDVDRVVSVAVVARRPEPVLYRTDPLIAAAALPPDRSRPSAFTPPLRV